MTRLAIASDHGGFKLKAALCKALDGWGVAIDDLGVDSTASADYPDYAHKLSSGIQQGRYSLGVLVCGTGIGMSIAANKHPGVRAAAVSDPYSARMSREHNHANVLCLGERVVGEGLALLIVRTWLDAAPDQDPRHLRRIDKLELPDPPT
ncbi:MAG: ribose 5-phosphate isomerase B [Deltaproteobacteria bacterium]|nr:ribose 5-phosphate isomerase B [Deltaproteobacteria bacterium]